MTSKNVALACALLLTFQACIGVTHASPPPVLVMSAAEDAGGVTQDNLDQPMLRAIEQRTVDLFSTKVQEALRAQGQKAVLPKLQVSSHYVMAKSRKLAVVRITVPDRINQVFLYGIVGTELRRVACARTSDYNQSIALFYGECGEKVKEVFGIDPLAN